MALLLAAIQFGWVPAPVARQLSPQCSQALPEQPDWRLLWPGVADHQTSPMGCGQPIPVGVRVWWAHCRCGSVTGPFHFEQGNNSACTGCYRDIDVLVSRPWGVAWYIRGSDGFLFDERPFWSRSTDPALTQR